MKNQQNISIYIACLAIACSLNSCQKGVEQKDATVDVVVSSNFEPVILSVELQNLYSPSDVVVDKEQRTMFVPTGKLSRADLTTSKELSVKYLPTTFDKIQNQLKKPKSEDLQKRITKYLSKVDVATLNSKETVEKDEKIHRIKAFIKQQQGDELHHYSKILFYSEKTGDTSWDGNPVYHSIDSIREILFETVSQNPKSKFLIIYNPPSEANELNKTSLSFNNAGESDNLAVKENAIPVSKPAYTVSQLNSWLNSIANGSDAARDQMRKLNSVRVNGAANISNVQQLIIDVSNGTRYRVTEVETGDNGKVAAITVRK